MNIGKQRCLQVFRKNDQNALDTNTFYTGTVLFYTEETYNAGGFSRRAADSGAPQTQKLRYPLEEAQGYEAKVPSF